MFPVDLIRFASQAGRLSRRRFSRPGSTSASVIRRHRPDPSSQRASRHPDWDAYYASEQADEAL